MISENFNHLGFLLILAHCFRNYVRTESRILDTPLAQRIIPIILSHYTVFQHDIDEVEKLRSIASVGGAES